MKSLITRAAIGAASLIVSAGAIAATEAGSTHSQSTMGTSPATSAASAKPTTTAAAPKQQTNTTRGPSKTGQPNQSCEDTPNTPGKSASAPGSAFNPDGKSGTVYAGEQPQNSRNTASVSQYDVACAKQPR